MWVSRVEMLDSNNLMRFGVYHKQIGWFGGFVVDFRLSIFIKEKTNIVKFTFIMS